MTPDTRTCTVPLRIAATHPSLAGHFPGRPIVPGVVLVDHALLAAEKWLGHPLQIRGIAQVKFVSPLAPEQDCVLELAIEPSERLRFTIRRDDDVIAQGTVVTANGDRD